MNARATGRADKRRTAMNARATGRADKRRTGPGRSADQHTVRRHNLSLVLNHIRGQGPLSRAAVAAATGINKATVSSLVLELVERGLVTEQGGPEQGAVGRPSQPMKLSGEHVCGIGVAIDVDRIAACVVDLSGQIRFRRVDERENRGSRPRTVIARAVKFAALAQQAAADGRLFVAGTTISVPGLIDEGGRHVHTAPNLRWQAIALADLFSAGFDALQARAHCMEPVQLINDANAEALAEMRQGAALGLHNFVYVTHGVGVGAGVVVDGAIFTGTHGFGGELGHITVLRNGPPCGCGNRGCLEALIGQDALFELASKHLGASVGKRPRHAIEKLAALAASGDRKALRVVDEIGRWLAIALATHVNLFDPQAIVLGGHAAKLEPWLRDRIRRELDSRVLGARWAQCAIRPALLAPDAALTGAGLLALERVLQDPTSVPYLDQGHTS